MKGKEALACAAIVVSLAAAPAAAQDATVLVSDAQRNVVYNCCDKAYADERRQCLNEVFSALHRLRDPLGEAFLTPVKSYIESLKSTDCNNPHPDGDGGGDDDGGGDSGDLNGCDVKRSLNDGYGGWLHKPVSDVFGNVVDIFPAGENPSRCYYESPVGKKLFDLQFGGNANPNRPTWRPAAGVGFCQSVPANSVLKCQYGVKWHCWRLPQPCARYD